MFWTAKEDMKLEEQILNIRKLLPSVSKSLLINNRLVFQQPQISITETW